ncbi:hypothetical protein ACFVHW_04260 [Streptomyces sp. NPDC127110]|uniref:hypothetical protein n=1 Tax=Streptomyces sp. NPDC127110 TaxID=3345362 RepID=UPI003642ADCB
MSTLLIGRWSDDGHTLHITESHQVEDGDQDAIDHLTGPAFSDGADWAVEFDVDRHEDAVQRAYDEYAHPNALVDDVDGFEPITD